MRNSFLFKSLLFKICMIFLILCSLSSIELGERFVSVFEFLWDLRSLSLVLALLYFVSNLFIIVKS
jgi:hypothetical protein